MLRVKVKALDAKLLGKRSFGDKDEFNKALAVQQQEGAC